MIISEFWWLSGFLKVIYELGDDDLVIKERSLLFSRDRRVPLSDLSPDFELVRQGIPRMLSTAIYAYTVLIIMDLFGVDLFDGVFRKVIASVVLLCLVIEHIRLFRVAKFPFVKECRAVQVRIKHKEFIEELAGKIREKSESSAGITPKPAAGSPKTPSASRAG